MKNINEDLNQIKAEPNTSANKEAQSKKLQHVGFGRYADKKSGQVTHIAQNDKLVPFNRAVKTNTFQTNNMDDYGLYGAMTAPDIQQLHEILTAQYSPEKYDDAELDAIYNYTTNSYSDINSRLSTLPSGVIANKIEKTSPDDTMPEFIATLDSAMKRVRSPVDFIAYARLSADYDVMNFASGKIFKFKPYRNASISLNSVINSAQASQTSLAGRPQITILQLMIPKNSRGIYAADFSSNMEDYEFILPRATMVEVVDGPKNVVGSDAMSQNMNLEIIYLDCKVKA